MFYILKKNQKQYKANLHCHSKLSDGHHTPKELAQLYKSNGYSILAITDHERPYVHQDLNSDDFIMITGYEAYIRMGETGLYDPYNKEIHINLFAKEPDNDRFICYDRRYARYIERDNALDSVKPAGPENTREYSVDFVNNFVKIAKENGYIAAYNHPYWSMEDESSILQYDGFFSLEIFNNGSFVSNRIEYAGPLYDKLLCHGKRLYCHATDDNHNHTPETSPDYDSFGGFTMIYPGEFTYSSIIEAMEKGEMYASTGPTFNEIYIDDKTVHVECSNVSAIVVYTGSKAPKHIYDGGKDSLTSADLKIDDRARYVRISIRDKYGRFADTRAFFPDEFDM